MQLHPWIFHLRLTLLSKNMSLVGSNLCITLSRVGAIRLVVPVTVHVGFCHSQSHSFPRHGLRMCTLCICCMSEVKLINAYEGAPLS